MKSKKKPQMSDSMITAMYQKILLKTPNKSANKIIEQFEGTAFKMRRKEALNVIKNLKRTNAEVMGSPDLKGMSLMERTDKSDLYKNKKPGFRVKFQKSALKTARREALAVSIRGKKKGLKAGSIKDLRDRMYQNVDAKAEYVEFYG